MSTMRIAVAGTCGLATIISKIIQEHTSHQLLVLSRTPQPTLTSQGYQCQTVDYNDPSSIQHSLMGVDTVISTVTGTPQLRLIEAAVQARVRRFAPAEFEGRPSLRPVGDPLDRGRAAALALLQHYRAYIQSTVFVCGILYERFAVGGLASVGIGISSGAGGEGDYVLDARNMTAQAPAYSPSGGYTSISMTSVYDVGRFVVRALDMTSWPAELTMCGERVLVSSLIQTVKQCRGRDFTHVQWHNLGTLNYELTLAQLAGDHARQRRLQTLIATVEGRYDFAVPGALNTQFPDIQPEPFRNWFARNWVGVP
ncbi:NAD(P)-binding protein [Mytilinidion resinicola]|uniref:NAD(P)-binding protein n=1 Tax=Mytilinidion resinicola TaxID=574789 RepID=A0A6A6Z987_9PEZI|nr:NAD(P)-binding protein [Mytilinidion resinicola]KAF2817368.1 NAD(P)-binding protein [Mytilinidion resinicola]